MECPHCKYYDGMIDCRVDDFCHCEGCELIDDIPEEPHTSD